MGFDDIAWKGFLAVVALLSGVFIVGTSVGVLVGYLIWGM